MIDNWYQMTGDDTAAKLKTSKTEGLTRKNVRLAQRRYGKNEIYPVSKITFYNCIKSITMDYTSYLLIATALIAAIFEETVGAWTLIILVTLNLIAALLAYTKSQKILEGMDRYTLPVVRVIREGRLFMIDQKQLVPGDLICLSRGDIVPADARLITAQDFCVDEERLFGRGSMHYKVADVALHETLPPEKQKNMAFAGTLVTAGEARAIVCATGEATVIAVTEKNHPIISHENMPLLGRLQKIVRVWSLVVLTAVFIMTLLSYLLPGMGNTLFSSFINAMSFAVSTMSEMYVAFGYIVLACAVWQTVHLFRESGNAGAILKNPLCMDKLRHITCLVVPKEGVLTTRDTMADRIFAEDKLYDIADRRGRRAMERPILYAILSTGMYGEAYLNKQQAVHGGKLTQTEEEASILNLARRMEIYNVRLDHAYPLLDHRPVGGDSEFETSLVAHKENYIAISRGETEHVLSRCAYYYKNGRIMLLSNEVRSQILIAYRKLVRQAYSIVAIASRSHTYNNLKFIGAAQKDMVFEGFVAFRVPYLRGVGQLISDAKDAKIKVILMSERPLASEIYFAKQVGIIDSGEQCVDAASLHKMKEGIRRTNASYYRLYCGLNAQQKLELIQYLHGEGEVVGVVGRRLEDLCLLRAADVSFAQNIAVQAGGVGQRDTVVSKVSESAAEDGCEALKFESDIIISDADEKGQGGFRAILNGIGIAKNTDMNVIRITKYLLCAQVARFLLVLYTIIFSKEGMSAVQALFSGLFMDFISVFILAFQKPSPDILRSAADAERCLAHPIKNHFPSILIGIAWACSAISASFFSELSGLAPTSLSAGSILFVTNCIISLLMLFSVQREDFIFRPGVRMNALHTLYLLIVTELFLLFFLFPKFGVVFGVASFAPITMVIIAVVCMIQLILAECIKILARMRENPAMREADQDTDERHKEITEMFHLFRSKMEQETTAEANSMAEEIAASSDAATVKNETSGGGFRKKQKNSAAMQMRNAEAAQTDDGVHEGSGTSLEEMERYVNAVRSAKKKAKQKKNTASKKQTKQASQKSAAPKKDWFSEDDVTPAEQEELIAVTGSQIVGSQTVGSQVETPFAPPLFKDDALHKAMQPIEDRPDQAAFEEAMAQKEQKEIEAATHDFTIGDNKQDAPTEAVRTFLRREEDASKEAETAQAADREFLGIGYLFSDEEYEAIMAEYNDDGTPEKIYNSDTQTFDSATKKDRSDKL